jgi:hypothetical protein
VRVFESRRQKLLPFPKFVGRVFLALCVAFAVLFVALGLGILGYHYLAGLGWLDALLNACMILTGMGPVNPITTPVAKIFASAYAIFSGVIFITVMAILLAPVFHRLIHKFHIDEE